MTVVVDANILIAFGLADEPLHTQAHRILSAWQTSGERLTAPRLFRSEITAVVRKAVYQERITPEQGRTMLAQLLIDQVDFHEDDGLLKEAYELLSVSIARVPMTPNIWLWRNGLTVISGRRMSGWSTAHRTSSVTFAGWATGVQPRKQDCP